MPHDYAILGENKSHKTERCRLCGRRVRWNKARLGRTDNVRYLREHVRQFAQPGGSTRRVYAKVYAPERLKILLTI